MRGRHDYLPFGEEIPSTYGSRSSIPGYSPIDGLRQKFTSKERDAETGLDYFGARYYSSIQGRFTSADVFGGSIFNPQTLNRYSYVINNPLNFNDPTGYAAQDTHEMRYLDELPPPPPPPQQEPVTPPPPPPPPPEIVLPVPGPVPDPPIPVDQKRLDQLTDRAIQSIELTHYIENSAIAPFVESMTFGLDENGKVTVTLGLSDPDAAIEALNNDKERFKNAGMGSEHTEEVGGDHGEERRGL